MNVLIVTGGNVDIDFIKNLIDKNNYGYIIAVDKGLESIYKLNIRPDYIVGDFDSVDKNIIEFYSGKCEKIDKFNPEKDYTDTDLGLSIAIEQNPKSITIVGATGTRLDHTLANIHILTKCLDANIKCKIVDRNNTIYLINKDTTIQKKDTDKKYVSLIPFTSTVEDLTLIGFKYNLKNYTLKVGVSLGVSNEIVENTATIKLSSGVLIVIESND